MTRAKNAKSRSHVAQTTKYAWVAAATLIVALMLGASVVTPQAQASIDVDSARYAALGNYYQGGILRGIDADAARYAALGNYYQDGIQRGIDADATRYAALGNYYQDGIQRGIDADAARYAALGRYYGDSFLAANPELMAARLYSSTAAQASQSGGLAANPELMTARRSYDQGTVSCSPGDEVLGANPELIFLRQARGC